MKRIAWIALALSGLAPAVPGAPAGAVPGTPVKATFTVSGRFLYEDKEWDYSGWTGARPELPVRGADVTVLDGAGKALGRGLTGADGTFAVECASKLPFVDVEVRVETRNRQHGPDDPFTPIAVVDPGGAVYSASSPVAALHDTGSDLDVGTTTVMALWLPEGDGNPFNLFDLAVSAWEHLTGPEVGAEHEMRGLRLHWPSVTGSWALGRNAWIAADDGYDDAVILHETGHVVHTLCSDNDSPGGVHYFGDSDQDPRLSFGEGYATFLAASVLDAIGRPGLYVDCEGDVLGGGVQLRLQLETGMPYASAVAGACDEVAVACTLFDLADDQASNDGSGGDDDGFVAGTLVAALPAEAAWWKVFTGPVRKASRVTMDDVWDGWLRLFGTQDEYASLHALFDQRALRFWNDGHEPDNAALLATDIASNGIWSGEHTLYYSIDPQEEAGTGDRDWFTVSLFAGQEVTIETRYPDGAWDACTQVDPWLALYSPAGKRLATDDNGGTGRNACISGFVAPESGSYTFMVRSRNATARYGRYEARVLTHP